MQKAIVALWNWIQRIAYIAVSIVFKVSGKKLTDDTFNAFIQFVKFGIVGMSNTIISYVIYIVGLVIFQRINPKSNYNYLLAQVLAFILSVLWSFYWNSRKVFVLKEGEERSIWKSLIKTFISYSFTGLLLNSILLILWVKVFGISEFIAPIINLVITVPLNFLINKLWAFKQG